MKSSVIIFYSSDPRGVSKFFVPASFFFVYISFCLIQLIFSSVTGKENFLTIIVPEGCLLIKAFALGKFGQKLVKLVSPIAKNTPS